MNNYRSIVPSGPNSESIAKARVKREMDDFCRKLGLPNVMGLYHIVDYKTKTGVEYKPMWSRIGYYYVLHMDRRGSPSIEVDMVKWSRENEDRAIARCVITYLNGNRYSEYGDAHKSQFEGKEKGTWHHTDTMARTRAMERCAMAATANGLTLLGYDRPLNEPVVVEVVDSGETS